MSELDKRHVWFRSMFEAIAKRLLAESTFGVQFRLWVGVILSVMDMCSDGYMVWFYFNSGDYESAYVTLGFICLCLAG